MSRTGEASSGGITRRTALRLALAGATGLVLAGRAGPSPGQASVRADEAPPSDQALWEIHELGRRIRSGEGTRLPDGIVIIDGWTLPPAHVARIAEITPA